MTPPAAAPVTTVVICDDHLVLAEGIALLVSAEPDIVVTGVVGSVAAVMESVDRSNPDVVLIDYELPDGNGAAATMALKLAHPQIQVVMLTSYSDEDVLIAAMEAGCSGFLTKQSGGQAVISAVRQAAAGEAVISASMLHRLLPQLRPTHRGVGAGLTTREREILELLADGVSGPLIAERLFLSSNTIRNHVQSVLNKLGVHSRLEAVAVAVQEGIIHRSF